jgi:glycosyltransferase involved in cell wall biosynthesis
VSGEVPRDAVSVIIATRNRRASVLETIERLRALPEEPPIVVVDNGSDDGSTETVRRNFPNVELIALPRNLGAAARTAGVRAARTPYVAFSDDDSWWEPGALARAAALLDRFRPLGGLAAAVLVGPEAKLDPTCLTMAEGRVSVPWKLPGPPVFGFIACGSVLRRDAYLAAGGFHPRFGVGGEEQLLAADLWSGGWGLAYASQVVARHVPSPVRNRLRRQRVVLRNALWFAWLRRSAADATRRSRWLARQAVGDPRLWPALAEAVAGLPWVMRERQPVPPFVERCLRVLEDGHPPAPVPVAPTDKPGRVGALVQMPKDASKGSRETPGKRPK